MRQDKLSKQNVILYLCGIIPVVWLGLLIAPCLKDGLPGLVQQFGSVMQNPFQIQLCEDSVKTVLTLLLVYGIAIGVYLSTEHNYRRREEHGSAKWGTAGSVNKKYANKDKTENKLLTQNVAIGLDGRKHRRNLNVLVCGGSGAGKTRFYAKPNIMNANTSFVVLDPKGELLRDTGYLLEEMGYEIKVLDLIDMEKSHCYNPFVYISSDDDIQRLTTNLFKNTTPKGSQTQDPFWDQTAAMLLKALVCYLHYEAPPDEQNFSMVMEMIRAGDVKEDNEEYQSVLDELFERLEERNPEHIALKYYRAYHSGSAKTLKSMLNRVTLNWKKGKRTHVFIDEFHVVFENEFSAQFFNSAWRQFRKRNAYPTAITQNVEYLLDSVQASTMLSNSEFVVMLNQAASDRGQLAKLLNISNEQMSYITNADAGCGLIKYGSALVPFINRFPQNTKLYQLMTTRPGEGKFARGRD